MGKNRLLTRLALAVTVAAGGGLLIGGVANAAPAAPLSATSLADNQSTTTTLIVAPSSYQGLPVALTAAVTPRAAGTVQFKDGEVNIGGPVTVRSGGQLTITLGSDTNTFTSRSSVAFTLTSTLSAGTHSLTAVFSPTDSTVSGSTSPAVPIVINPPLPIDSFFSSLFGGLPNNPSGLHLNLDLGPIFGAPTNLDTGQIRLNLGGLLSF